MGVVNVGMLDIYRGDERGVTKTDWLESKHTFSFGEYHDPRRIHFHSLRVINDDWVAGGGGFPMHGHRDMEILTYIIEGELGHKDSLGNGDTIRPGELQVMSAGTGIQHSEFNPSETEPVRLIQIWLFPEAKGLEPRYDKATFDLASAESDWVLLAAREEEAGAVKIFQDAKVLAGRPRGGNEFVYDVLQGRAVFMQVLSGKVQIGEQTLVEGDALGTDERIELVIRASEDSELILFDLAARFA